MKTDSELMGEAIDRSPWDDAARNAMQDALEEEGVSHVIAVEVATVRAYHARQAHCLARAAKFLATRGRARAALNDALRGECLLGASMSFTLLLLLGSSPPRAGSDYQHHPGAYWYEWTVTVGAEWVLQWRDRYGERIVGAWEGRRRKRRRRFPNNGRKRSRS